MIVVGVRFDPPDHKALLALAKARRVSLSALIRLLALEAAGILPSPTKGQNQ